MKRWRVLEERDRRVKREVERKMERNVETDGERLRYGRRGMERDGEGRREIEEK